MLVQNMHKPQPAGSWVALSQEVSLGACPVSVLAAQGLARRQCQRRGIGLGGGLIWPSIAIILHYKDVGMMDAIFLQRKFKNEQ